MQNTTLGIYVQITEKTLWSVVSQANMTLSYQGLREWQKYDKQQQ